MNNKLLAYTTIIATLGALSGWGKFFYDWNTSKPKIKGQIFNVIIGELLNPADPTEKLTSFLVYLYLTNERKNSVHILDYELEVDAGKGYEKLERVYGLQKATGQFKFESKTHQIDLGNFVEKLIYQQKKPVEYGVPLHGFVLFASKVPHSYFIERLTQLKFRVTCIDAFKGKHRITSVYKDIPNINLLQDIADITLRPKN